MPDEPVGLPDFSGDPNRQGEPDRSGPQRRSRRRAIPSVEDCIKMLFELAGLMTMGMIGPAQGNAVRGAIRDALQFQLRAQGATAPTASAPLQAELLEQLRNNPQLLNLLEPLLSEEQIAAILKGITNGPQPQA
jgi:hypothetical protein